MLNNWKHEDLNPQVMTVAQESVQGRAVSLCEVIISNGGHWSVNTRLHKGPVAQSLAKLPKKICSSYLFGNLPTWESTGQNWPYYLTSFNFFLFFLCSQIKAVAEVDSGTWLGLKWFCWLANKLANEKGWLWNWPKGSQSKVSREQGHINPCTVFLHNRFPTFTNISTQKIHIKTKGHLVRTYR